MRRCFVFVRPATGDTSTSPHRKTYTRRKSATCTSLLNRKPISSSWSYLKSYFTKKNHRTPATAAASSHRLPPSPVRSHDASGDHEIRTATPCTACGEIFPKRQLLDDHLAVSELSGEDSGHNVVKIIFTTSWENKHDKINIHRILKIHNSKNVLSRFEDCREAVKSKAAARISVAGGGGGGGRDDARCIADGNEMLRFHCSTFMCGLGQDGNSALCNNQFCSVCGIIRSGFSAKLDGVSTLATSWRAHVAIPDETMEEFGFMHVKRAMLICRVVAGRVGVDGDESDMEGCGFDSVAGRVGDEVDEEELVVLNPMAVLPCFVVVYTVTV